MGEMEEKMKGKGQKTRVLMWSWVFMRKGQALWIRRQLNTIFLIKKIHNYKYILALFSYIMMVHLIFRKLKYLLLKYSQSIKYDIQNLVWVSWIIRIVIKLVMASTDNRKNMSTWYWRMSTFYPWNSLSSKRILRWSKFPLSLI